MDFATKLLTSRDREIKRTLEAQQAKEERELRRVRNHCQSVLDFRKDRAVRHAHGNAALVVVRMNADQGEGWKNKGKTARVCRRSGPHRAWSCLLHRKTIALVQIPGMTQPMSKHDQYKWAEFYVGSDGYIYRDGFYKIYRAELIRRNWPSEILAVANKIMAIQP